MGLSRFQHLKQELIDAAVERARTSLPADRAEDACEALRQIFRFVPPRDLAGWSQSDVYAAGLALWQFIQARPPGKALVRVSNPTVRDQGWHSTHTILEVVSPDMPFLVDSMKAAVNRHGLTVHLIIHPIMVVERDGDGRLTRLVGAVNAGDGAAGTQTETESVLHLQIDHVSDPAEQQALVDDVHGVLSDIRTAVADWHTMRDAVSDIIGEVKNLPQQYQGKPIQMATEFLRWLGDNNFTFLGYREYTAHLDGPAPRLLPIEASGLGILRDPEVQVFGGLRSAGVTSPQTQAFLRQSDLMMVTKSSLVSRIHRAVPMDVVAIKRFSRDGALVGERLYVGLFTSSAYARSASQVPFLADKVDWILDKSGLPRTSHGAKKLSHILDTYPRDELFQIGTDKLYEIALGILHMQDRQQTTVFLRVDPFERYVSALTFVPRERYDTHLRLRMQRILEEELGGTSSQFYTNLDDNQLARIHFVISTTPGHLPEIDDELIETKIINAARSWQDMVEEALIDQVGEERARSLLAKYDGAFSSNYRERSDARTAIFDMEQLEQLERGEPLRINLYRPVDAGPRQLALKVYLKGAPVVLSDVLPTLENMGLRVLQEVPFEVFASDLDRRCHIHDFMVEVPDDPIVEQLVSLKDLFHEAFRAVWLGAIENDAFNALVLAAGLDWREVVILRALARYLRQARIPFSQGKLARALAQAPEIARQMVQLFHWRLDPARRQNEDAAVAADHEAAETVQRINDLLADVADVSDDQILRRFLNLTECVLRTNYYQVSDDGLPKAHLSLKLDGYSLVGLPEPRLWREIFVYSPLVEAIHLRGGPVARGGLRWSDRREDFRTEVLGLVKAQMVKNSVIVPVGSKGGFYVKDLPADRDGRQQKGIEGYQTFLRGMLDITDNVKDGVLVPPSRVVRTDGDDPYLVVAADKGTATFSDIANGVSADYDFWLSDGFASGGSAGYDHKGMGITARGAWESVKRHFREMGHDTQTQPFTVIGVGDMSGDVFGNGMLLSDQIKLIAAFNHLHIFVDPDPDPARSFTERKRLFDLPRSNWADYDETLLSQGGRIYPRSAKKVSLTPQIQAMTGLEAKEVSPNDLLQALLQSACDLMWFGGIGTYVRSEDETNEEVGDKANDAIRITGRMLKAKVVGEGANLGMTQYGRIEYAQNGGRLNTDFIDNSAGVDTSDHEVNIKILLKGELDAGRLSLEDRNSLLEAMTDDVAHLVLQDNYRQSGALTLEECHSGSNLGDHERFMRRLEQAGRLNRAVEDLPDDEDLAQRRAVGRGLTRPELAVLLCYAKIDLYDKLLHSDLPDDPDTQAEAFAYFPAALRERYPEAITSHPLKREIICTVLANELVNRLGISAVSDLCDSLSAEPARIVRAYLVARAVFDVKPLWDEIDGLDNQIPASGQTAMLIQINRLLHQAIGWLVMHGARPLPISGTAQELRGGVETLISGIESMVSPGSKTRRRQRAEALCQEGVPSDEAMHYALLPLFAAALDITHLAQVTNRDLMETATTWFSVGDRFSLQWLRDQAQTISGNDPWQQAAVGSLVDEMYLSQSQLTQAVLASSSTCSGYEGVDAWRAAVGTEAERVRTLLGELRAAPGGFDLARLAVASRRIGDLARLPAVSLPAVTVDA